MLICYTNILNASAESTRFVAKGTISTVRYAAETKNLYIGCQDTVTQTWNNLSVLDTYSLRHQSILPNDNIVFVEPVTVNETISFFTCFKNNPHCYVFSPECNTSKYFDLRSNVTLRYSTMTLNIRSETADTNTKYILVASDVDISGSPGPKPNNLFLFAYLKITTDDNTGILVQDISGPRKRLQPTFKFNFLYGFQHEALVYFIVKYNSSTFGPQNAVLQLDPRSPTLNLMEARLKCGADDNLIDAVVLDSASGRRLFLLFGRQMCAVYMNEVESLLGKPTSNKINEGQNSCPTWLLSKCTKEEDRLATSPVIGYPVFQLSFSDEVRVMTAMNQNDANVVFLLTSKLEIIKVSMNSGEELSRTSIELSTTAITDMWTSDDRLLVGSAGTIVSINTIDCDIHKTFESCHRDTISCVWCQINNNDTNTVCERKEDCTNAINMRFDPRVSHISPSVGARQGGTLITIHGDHFDIAEKNKFRVSLGENHCFILSEFFSSLSFVCAMPAQESAASTNVCVLHDGKLIYQTLFTYLEPKIERVSPNSTIVSGGTTIILSGSNLQTLDGISVCLMHGADPDKVLSESRCQVKGMGTQLICTTPQSTTDGYFNLSLSYYLCNSSMELFLDNGEPLHVRVHKDPVIRRVVGQYIANSSNLTLTIYGDWLTLVNESEINITVCQAGGVIVCILKTVYDNNLTCEMQRTPRFMSPKINIKMNFGQNLFLYFGIYESNTTSNISEATMTNTKRTPSTATAANSIHTASKPATAHDVKPLTEKTNLNFIPIGVSIGVVALLVLTILLVLCRWRTKMIKRKRNRSNLDVLSVANNRVPRSMFGDVVTSHSRSLSGTDLSLNESQLAADHYDDSKEALIQRFEDEKLLIKRHCIVISKLIGQGHFGSVFKGYLVTENEKVDVAIKTLHQNENREKHATQFLQEAYVMKNFKHSNVMQLVGLCMDMEETPLVILPFMKHGDLLSYLHEDRHIPTVKDLVSFGLDIVNGMEYLSKLKFVHRDLAARNCMLDAGFRVLVADFGLSRDMYETSYYSTRNKGTELPVKWMAIESLSNGIFNEKTDVWSFGVTLWELMTRGVRPYAVVDNWDMERYLKSGRRLPQPLYCPTQLYKIMRLCWSINPDDRPLFSNITLWITDMLDRVHHQLGDSDRDTNISTVYLNSQMGANYVYENICPFEDQQVE